jgi:hypothetical protein
MTPLISCYVTTEEYNLSMNAEFVVVMRLLESPIREACLVLTRKEAFGVRRRGFTGGKKSCYGSCSGVRTEMLLVGLPLCIIWFRDHRPILPRLISFEYVCTATESRRVLQHA